MAWTKQTPNTTTWASQSPTTSTWTPQPTVASPWATINNETVQGIYPEKMWGLMNLEWGYEVQDGMGGTEHTAPLPENNLWGTAFYYDSIPYTLWNLYSSVTTTWTKQS